MSSGCGEMFREPEADPHLAHTTGWTGENGMTTAEIMPQVGTGNTGACSGIFLCAYL